MLCAKAKVILVYLGGSQVRPVGKPRLPSPTARQRAKMQLQIQEDKTESHVGNPTTVKAACLYLWVWLHMYP